MIFSIYKAKFREANNLILKILDRYKLIID